VHGLLHEADAERLEVVVGVLVRPELGKSLHEEKNRRFEYEKKVQNDLAAWASGIV
jgi:hypothetical protein